MNHFCDILSYLMTLTGFDGSLNPVDKLGDSCVDARFHGIGTSQTPGRDTLQDIPVLGITH